MKFDLSLNNAALYEGCQIQGGKRRKNLMTPMGEAVPIVRRNALTIFKDIPVEERGEIELTGRMKPEVYLTVYHLALLLFREVYYNNGSGAPRVLVSIPEP